MSVSAFHPELRAQRLDAVSNGDLERLMLLFNGVDVDSLVSRAPAAARRDLRLAQRHPHLVGMPGHQTFSELVEPVLDRDLSAVSPAAATETVLWTPNTTTLPHTAIPANTLRSGQTVKVRASGLMTVPATPGTVIITPRFGTSTAGVTLGASAPAVAAVASLTNTPWVLQFDAIVRTTGSGAATTGVLVGGGTFESAGVARDIVFGGTTATIDTTAAGGIVFGITDSVISLSYTPKMITLVYIG